MLNDADTPTRRYADTPAPLVKKPTRRYADPPIHSRTRRHAKTPIRRHADTPLRRYPDTNLLHHIALFFPISASSVIICLQFPQSKITKPCPKTAISQSKTTA